MAEFKVKTEWNGYVVQKFNYFTMTSQRGPFMTVEVTYDLIVTPNKVELAVPPTEKIDKKDKWVVTKKGWAFYSIKEACSKFNGKGQGWFVQDIDCVSGAPRPPAQDKPGEGETPTQDKPGEGEAPGGEGGPSEPGTSGEGIATSGSEDATAAKGLVVRYKGLISSTPILVTTHAKTIKKKVGANEVDIPIGEAGTSTGSGAQQDAQGKYALCPDGDGDYTVSVIEQVPEAFKVLLTKVIYLKWRHVK